MEAFLQLDNSIIDNLQLVTKFYCSNATSPLVLMVCNNHCFTAMPCALCIANTKTNTTTVYEECRKITISARAFPSQKVVQEYRKVF